MARDKLITIRIEGEKRDLFNQLAKSQNTDTASLLYDFINQCLSGQLDISLVTGKGNRLDNQIDTNRIDNQLDKLETTTQRLDERLGIITKKLNDWIEAFDDRLTDCDRGLSGKMISLEHRLNALAIQLDSQKDRQQIDRIDNRIDTDSQWIDDMEYLLKREKECSIASPIPTIEGGNGDNPDLPPSPPDRPATAIASIDGTVETVEPISTIETVASAIETIEETDSTVEDADTVETANEPVSTIETGPGAIETVTGETSKTSKGLNPTEAHNYLISQGIKAAPARRTLNDWVKQGKISDTSPQGKNTLKHLTLRDGLYFPKTDQG